MSFGKDESTLGNVQRYRQDALEANKKRSNKGPKTGGSGRMPTFINQFQPSKTDPDMIRIIPGDYKVEYVDDGGALQTVNIPWFAYRNHWDSRHNRSCQCSAGPYVRDKNRRQPCRGCDEYYSNSKKDASGKWKTGYMGGPRDMSAFSIIHFAQYAKNEQKDANGAFRMNPKTNEPYYEWVRITPQNRAELMGKEVKNAHMMHWPMGDGHHKVLMSAWKQIEKHCRSCGGTNSIVSDAWVCPSCSARIVDSMSSTLDPKQLDELTSEPMSCPSCHNRVRLVELVDCTNCNPGLAHLFNPTVAQAPERATIFDVEMNVMRVEAADGSNNTTLQISGWTAPHPLAPELAELKPYELNKVYAPTSIEEQTKVFQLPPMQVQPPTAGRQPVPVAHPYTPPTGVKY